MSRIDALNLSFQPSFIQHSRKFTDANAVKESVNFAELFSSLIVKGQAVGDDFNGGQLEVLEEIMQYLLELPLENLSTEEEEMVYGVSQMLSMQTTDVEGIDLSLKKQLPDSYVHEKMNSIIHLLDPGLPGLLPAPIIIDDPPELLGGDDGQTKLEAVITKIVSYLEGAKKERLADRESFSLQQPSGIEKLVRQLTNRTQDAKAPVQITTTTPAHNGQNKENFRSVSNQTEVNGMIPNSQLIGGQIEESSHTQFLSINNAQGGPKAVQATGYVETTEPARTIRMSNLIEELGSVFRGSFRLARNPEGTQIRINITPEHLGHLDIRFTESNGKIAAHIFTSTLVAKEVLDLQMNQMRNLLHQQGIPLDKIEVTHQNLQSYGQQTDHRFSQQHEEKQRAASHEKSEYERIDEEVAVERNQLSDLSMNVNYTV